VNTMAGPGPRNLITDVAGIAVGNAHDATMRTGVTVVLPERPCVAAVDVRGGGTGSRELALLDPAGMVQRVDALVLSGGSAFGLDAAGGAMSWLAARNRGFPIRGGDAIVPIVPQAILFDLLNGGDKRAFRDPTGAALPYRHLAKAAFDTAGADFALGNAGAGFGAKAGSLKGGLGSASVVLSDGVTVGALAAVNSHGETTYADGTFLAWDSAIGDELGGRTPTGRPTLLPAPVDGDPAANTTLAIVATDLALTRGDAQRVAVMAQDGLARAIRPVHTPFDGDTVFVLSTGTREPTDRTADIARIGASAADCVARAIARGVHAAATLGDMVGWRDRFG
jgi:L-aminopeptidase/D-esterase-like protein